MADTKTGVGMAEWALRAYNEGWKYSYGGSSVGSVDCSGLIRSYAKCGGGAKAILNASPQSGNISSLPRIHGLGLWCDGHAGVYVGKNDSGTNMSVDMRNSRVNVVYDTMDSRSWNPWVKWFKVPGVTYPTTGWVTYNGNKYYYYNGEFVVGTFTVDGVSYDFGKSGALKGKASATTAAPTTTTTTTTTTKAPTTTTTTTTTTKAPASTAAQTTAAQTTAAQTTTAQTTVTTTTTTEKKTTTTATTAKKTTATTTAVYSVTLHVGDVGNSVTRVQKRLIELGYLDTEATGYYGMYTEKAVKLFQKQMGMTADGIAGKGTQEALFSSSAPHYSPTTTTTTTSKSTTTKVKVSSTTTGVTTTTAPHTTAETKPAPTQPEKPAILDIGSTGDKVTRLQQRLAELGYFEQEVTGYYGAFTRDAVMMFQRNCLLVNSGVADEETQNRLYADNAPTATEYDDIITLSEDYTQIEVDEYDLEEEQTMEAEPEKEVVYSDGISELSGRSDINLFLSRYGGAEGLQTLGVCNYSQPSVTVFRDGESYELDYDTCQAIDDCVFF